MQPASKTAKPKTARSKPSIVIRFKMKSALMINAYHDTRFHAYVEKLQMLL